MFLGLGIALLVLILDQLSKWWVQAYINNTASHFSFGGFFNLVEAWNNGVSFSMFNNGGMLGIILLSAFAIGVIIFLIYWLKNEKNRLTQVSLGFIIGGALGNVTDRLRFGAVYDFLDFYYKNWHWPAFNLADTFICIGALIIIVYGVLHPECSLKKKG